MPPRRPCIVIIVIIIRLNICATPSHRYISDVLFFCGVYFLPRDAIIARYMLSSCVCPSVHLNAVRQTFVFHQNG